MPASRPPGVTMTWAPSTSGDSLMSQGILRPPNSRRMLRCHTTTPSWARRRGQVAALGQDVQAIAVNGRRASRSRSPIVVPARADRTSPDHLAVRAVQADHHALAVAERLHEHARAADGQRTVAGPQVGGGPRQRRPRRRPLRRQTGLARDAVALRPAPLRPVRPGTTLRASHRQQQHGARQRGGHTRATHI